MPTPKKIERRKSVLTPVKILKGKRRKSIFTKGDGIAKNVGIDDEESKALNEQREAEAIKAKEEKEKKEQIEKQFEKRLSRIGSVMKLNIPGADSEDEDEDEEDNRDPVVGKQVERMIQKYNPNKGINEQSQDENTSTEEEEGETPKSDVPEKYVAPVPRSMKKRSSKFNLKEGGALGMKNIFRSTAKFVVKDKRSKEREKVVIKETIVEEKEESDETEEEEEEEEVEEKSQGKIDSQNDLRIAAEKADNILRTNYDGKSFGGKPRWSNAWNAAVKKMEAFMLPPTSEDTAEKTKKMKDVLDNITKDMESQGYVVIS